MLVTRHIDGIGGFRDGDVFRNSLSGLLSVVANMMGRYASLTHDAPVTDEQ
jgi:hypothetical protein